MSWVWHIGDAPAAVGEQCRNCYSILLVLQSDISRFHFSSFVLLSSLWNNTCCQQSAVSAPIGHVARGSTVARCNCTTQPDLLTDTWPCTDRGGMCPQRFEGNETDQISLKFYYLGEQQNAFERGQLRMLEVDNRPPALLTLLMSVDVDEDVKVDVCSTGPGPDESRAGAVPL
jgi:hypothetical protein